MFEITEIGRGSLAIVLLTLLWWPMTWFGWWWCLRRGPKWQRFAEIPHITQYPVLYFLIACSLHFLGLDVVQFEQVHPFVVSLIQVLLWPLRILIGWLAWQAFSPVIDLFFVEFTERSYNSYGRHRERNISLVLMYLAKPLLIIIIIGVLFLLSGMDLAGYLVTFGGMSVAVAFALQSVLTNIFAGLSLALDTPFSQNDLIKVGQGKQIYQVIKRGLRITVAKDIASHETVYLPNRSMTEEVLVDITRPTDDLRSVIDLRVRYDSNLRVVRSVLTDIAHGHPHVIGDLKKKQKAIHNKVFRLYIRQVFEECTWHFIELARLRQESLLNHEIQSFIRKVENWSEFVDQAEQDGFDAEEKKWMDQIAEELQAETLHIANMTTQWQILFRNCQAKGANIPKFIHNQPEQTGWKPDPKVVDAMICSLDLKAWDGEEVPGKCSDETIQFLLNKNQGATSKETEQKRSKHIREKLEWLALLLDELSLTISDLFSGVMGDSENWGNDEIFSVKFYPVSLTDKRREKIIGKGHGQEQTEGSVENPMRGFTRTCTYSRGAKLTKKRMHWFFEFKDMSKTYQAVHYAFAVAHRLSKIVAIPPETIENKEEYETASDAVETILERYSQLGEAYGELLQDLAEHMVKEERLARPFIREAQKEEFHNCFTQSPNEHGFNILLCRNREEDLFISQRASEHVLNHPLNEAYCGRLLDDDEKRDLTAIFQVWGDKVFTLMNKTKHIHDALKKARSSTIDTRLRELATWMREGFKDPHPAWKYPLAPVEGFGENGIEMTMKFYVDNVRMERYLRPYNTYTQIRLRIAERLSNANIIMPLPQRDLYLKSMPQGGEQNTEPQNETKKGADAYLEDSPS
ncbi:mechanosensitive ion channel domain-containing protein [Magnetococcus sp. PR-3]|uniref:mechanosensitive ion channel domain-containing protein n=1 Tax=Magnetococcus sp. PR-3 TaxID=3120355 RepID=UPI002FCDED48